jgi:hypothetical protein
MDESDGYDSNDRSKHLSRKESLDCNHCINKIEKGECRDEDMEGVEAAIPLMRDSDGDWVVHAQRTQYIRGQFHDFAVLCLTLACLVLCAVFYVLCPRCLFGVLIFSACLCPWFNSLNLTLWVALILLVLSGWTFSTGALSITWNSGF